MRVNYKESLLKNLTPEYEVFKKRFPRILKEAENTQDRDYLIQLRREFSQLIKTLQESKPDRQDTH